jgi:predicted XRE-type DNA-binding protein
MAKISNEPKLRQYLVLAYQIQEKLDVDNAITSKQIAGWLGITPPRISQILDLLLLCPAIQQDILLSKDKNLYLLGEYNVRKIVKEPLWEKQLEIWSTLLKSS